VGNILLPGIRMRIGAWAAYRTAVLAVVASIGWQKSIRAGVAGAYTLDVRAARCSVPAAECRKFSPSGCVVDNKARSKETLTVLRTLERSHRVISPDRRRP